LSPPLAIACHDPQQAPEVGECLQDEQRPDVGAQAFRILDAACEAEQALGGEEVVAPGPLLQA
jgi:hypothetical protein